MMTPEEIQRTMDFILESQANSVVRMDRLEEDLKLLKEENRQTKESILAHHESILAQKESVDALKETVHGLLLVTQDLVKISSNVADRTKKLESRSDGFDEMLKVLRELRNSNLRPPDKPRQDES